MRALIEALPAIQRRARRVCLVDAEDVAQEAALHALERVAAGKDPGLRHVKRRIVDAQRRLHGQAYRRGPRSPGSPDLPVHTEPLPDGLLGEPDPELVEWLGEWVYPGEVLLREEATRAALGTTPMSMAEREALLLRLRQTALSHAPRWRYL